MAKKQPALGVNNAAKVFCKKHDQFHPEDETCKYCVEPDIADEDTCPGDDSIYYLPYNI